MGHRTNIILHYHGFILGFVHSLDYRLHVQELVGFNRNSDRELVQSINSNAAVTDLPLLVGLALVQDVHGLEVLFETV